jgi:hypothetical protein
LSVTYVTYQRRNLLVPDFDIRISDLLVLSRRGQAATKKISHGGHRGYRGKKTFFSVISVISVAKKISCREMARFHD